MDTSAFRPRGGRKEARERRSRKKNPDGSMTLVEHLYELRHRLGWALLGVVLGAILGCLWFNYSIPGIPTLGKLITGPYCALPHNQLLGAGQGCRLLQTKPFEAFMLILKTGIATGVVFSSPVWLYQIWAFITPGLYAKERKYAVVFVFTASALFAVGAVVAYLVLPEALKVLTGVGSSDFVTALAGSDYVSFLINLLVIFGVSFELPLLVVMLNFTGVLKYEKISKMRRGIIFALFVFASIATPGGDPISMIALGGALTVLFEIAAQIARVHDKRLAQRRKNEGWDTENPDVASELDYTPEPVGAPEEPAAVIEAPVDGSTRGRFDDAT